MRPNRGFSIIELLVVLLIIGVITAIAVPAFLDALERGRQRRTVGDMRTIASALQAYSLDHDQYPPGDLAAIEPVLTPDYVQNLPQVDGWKTDFVYATDGVTFTLTSLGRDKAAGGGDPPNPDGTTNCFQSDIVWVDSQFRNWPDGGQRDCS